MTFTTTFYYILLRNQALDDPAPETDSALSEMQQDTSCRAKRGLLCLGINKILAFLHKLHSTTTMPLQDVPEIAHGKVIIPST